MPCPVSKITGGSDVVKLDPVGGFSGPGRTSRFWGVHEFWIILAYIFHKNQPNVPKYTVHYRTCILLGCEFPLPGCRVNETITPGKWMTSSILRMYCVVPVYTSKYLFNTNTSWIHLVYQSNGNTTVQNMFRNMFPFRYISRCKDVQTNDAAKCIRICWGGAVSIRRGSRVEMLHSYFRYRWS